MSVSRTPCRQRTEGDHVRLYTHNIWCRHGNWAARRRVRIDGIRELEPELITFQETRALDDDDEVLAADFSAVPDHARLEPGDAAG